MPEQFIKPLQEKAKAIGLWLLDVPTEYGGAGLDLMSRCVIMEEVARTIAIPFRYAPIFGPEVRPVLFHCNDEQKNASAAGDRRQDQVCFAQTGPTPAAVPPA
jgi:acyl-CoA dehydrogenase